MVVLVRPIGRPVRGVHEVDTVTVKEVIEALFEFDLESNVYVPDMNGRAEIAQNVCGLVHTNLPDGITIPNDVTITPWTDEQFNELQNQ